MIGSGGWLAQTDAFSPADCLADHAIDARGRRVLLPRKFDYYRDEAYLSRCSPTSRAPIRALQRTPGSPP